MTVIEFAAAKAARLSKRASSYGMTVNRLPDGSYALVGLGMRKPELVGTLLEVERDLDVLDRQAQEPNEDIQIR